MGLSIDHENADSALITISDTELTGFNSLDTMIQSLNTNMQPFLETMAFYRCAAMEIETKFKVLNEELSLNAEHNPIESIKTRIKRPESIINKMKSRDIPMTLDALQENIDDVAGVRVICSFPSDIYFLANCLTQQDDIKLLQWKDYIEHPKPSGYRSLHLIVEVPIFLQYDKRQMKVEVQLRTIAMDFWASLEHKLRYKKNLSPELLAKLEDELLDCSNKSAELDWRMQKIRKNIADG